MKSENRDQMEKYFRLYVKETWGTTDEADLERQFAGIMAFLWSNLYSEPYQPIYFDSIEEQPRPWWQVWRRK